MAKRRQPSHPSQHTAQRLTEAFDAMRTKPKFTAAPPKNARPSRPLGIMPTPERERRAPAGIDYRPLSNNAGHVRPTVRAPWELTEERVHRITSELAQEPEPYYRMTRADLAFEDHDGPLVKEALNSYIRAVITINRRSTSHDNVTVDKSADGKGVLPYSGAQEHAYRLIAFVHKALGNNRRDLASLRQMVNMFAPIDGGSEQCSLETFAVKKAGIKDPKVREGFTTGFFYNLGERLYDLLNSQRAANELASLRLAA